MLLQAELIQPVIWENNQLKLLDQRALPHEEKYLSFDNLPDVAQAISDMVVRGAPAIGITAAYAIVLAVKKHYQNDKSKWKLNLQPELKSLSKARPTAVNLRWAINKMSLLINELNGDPVTDVLSMAKKIHQQDIDNNRLMGKLGSKLMAEGETKPFSVLTHCNAGALATGGYGTALGVIRSAWEQRIINHVYADETRPWLQGARLTAWEMVKENIPVSLIVEGAASRIIQQSQSSDSPVKWIIVGSDRIAANGDVANKIGTFNLAIIARYLDIQFMVVAPTSTIDFAIASGKDVPIEERNTSEVTVINQTQTSPEQAGAKNPAFDVTPAELVDAIVTEKGVVMQPDVEKMKRFQD